MNEEYLWDKTGEDAETERLENALKSFRYRENAPPRIAIHIENKKRFISWTSDFGIPALACCALIFTAVAFWLVGFDGKSKEIASSAQPTEKIIRLAHNASPETADSEYLKTENKKSADFAEPPMRETKIRKVFGKKSLSVAKKSEVKMVFARKTDEAKTEHSASGENLTADEKYAYDQLIKALAITGSTIKQVQEKIYRAENRSETKEIR